MLESIDDIDKRLVYCNIDFIDYKEAWDLQKHIFEKRLNKTVPDVLLLLEHPHTYTLGKTADKENLVGTEKYLSNNNISVYNIDRGGDITYHGPGQIVGYPIIDLKEWKPDTHLYLRSLEEVIIRTCAHYGIEAGREPKYTGVWINEKKIAAIGIKVTRWITMHGFAFNVNTDLSLFSGIIPCGIADKDVTSLERELKIKLKINEVKEILLNNFKSVFGYSSTSIEAKNSLET
ncbi:MAG: lipoyl(octanoyl) transferase LipB [Ignavibacteriaceae bacterium]|nr:lipoyl(octanoyl) transferase LipB [Ignavibacteriaceae bacterium]